MPNKNTKTLHLISPYSGTPAFFNFQSDIIIPVNYLSKN